MSERLFAAIMGSSLILILLEGLFRGMFQKTPLIGWILQIFLSLVEFVVCSFLFIYILFF